MSQRIRKHLPGEEKIRLLKARLNSLSDKGSSVFSSRYWRKSGQRQINQNDLTLSDVDRVATSSKRVQEEVNIIPLKVLL